MFWVGNGPHPRSGKFKKKTIHFVHPGGQLGCGVSVKRHSTVQEWWWWRWWWKHDCRMSIYMWVSGDHHNLTQAGQWQGAYGKLRQGVQEGATAWVPVEDLLAQCRRERHTEHRHCCFGTKPGLIRLCGHRGGVTVEFERNVYYQMFHLLKKSNSNRLVSFPVQVQMYAKRLLHRCRVRYSHVAAACL